MQLSIIIPTFNEQVMIENTLRQLHYLRQIGHEIIIVDGHSEDNTAKLAENLADQCIISPRGRATQLNQGAEAAKGDILLFLHADTLLPQHIDQLIINALQTHSSDWGRFNVQLSGQAKLLRIIEWLMNKRSCLTGIVTGDQAIFIKRHLFDKVNGFPDQALMEDIEISRRLKRFSRPICMQQKVVTSSRRWEEKGIIRTILLMWGLRLGYFLGFSPNYLKKFYYTSNCNPQN